MRQRKMFREQLASGRTIWSAGAYDALSAKMIEAAGFDALLTTGFGISASMLGQPDVELYTMTENLNVVRQVIAAVEIPVVADCDTGYGNAVNVMRTVREFERAGAAAVILEDQVVPKRCPAIANVVEVLPLNEGVAKIRAAVEARTDPDLVIIARTDAPTEAESIERIKAYVAAGADMVQPISKTFKDVTMLKRLKLAAGVPVSLQVLGWLEDLTADQLSDLVGNGHLPAGTAYDGRTCAAHEFGSLGRSEEHRQSPAPAHGAQAVRRPSRLRQNPRRAAPSSSGSPGVGTAQSRADRSAELHTARIAA